MKVLQLCGECRNELGNFSVKKENMMLSSPSEMVWCSECNSLVHEIREVVGRVESIDNEQNSYPRSLESW
jgi:hypothetical protein